MSDLKFPTPSDATMRIDGGIGLYRGRPKHIIYEEGNYVSLRDLLDGGSLTVNMNDEELITRSLPTGYCDIKWNRRVFDEKSGRNKYVPVTTVAFFARGSYRKQKSTIHPSNLAIRLPSETGSYLDSSATFMYTPEFGRMLIGEFSPNRSFVGWELYQGQAMSRNFAILQLHDEQVLLFNEAQIGKRSVYTDGFSLDPEYVNSLMIARLAQANIPVG